MPLIFSKTANEFLPIAAIASSLKGPERLAQWKYVGSVSQLQRGSEETRRGKAAANKAARIFKRAVFPFSKMKPPSPGLWKRETKRSFAR